MRSYVQVADEYAQKVLDRDRDIAALVETLREVLRLCYANDRSTQTDGDRRTIDAAHIIIAHVTKSCAVCGRKDTQLWKGTCNAGCGEP